MILVQYQTAVKPWNESLSLSTMPFRFSSFFSYTSLLVIREFRVILHDFEVLRLLPWAVQIPHLEVRTLQISHLIHYIIRGQLKWCAFNDSQQNRSMVMVVLLTQRAVSKRGQVRRAAFSLLVRSSSFSRFSAKETAFSSYSFILIMLNKANQSKLSFNYKPEKG